MPKKTVLYFLVIMAFVSSSCRAMVFDNRFIPLIARPRLLVDDFPSFFAVDGFAATASRAFANNENQIGIPEIWGQYNQGQHANSFVLAGRPNPLRSDWQGLSILWRMTGKLQAQGAYFTLHKSITDYISTGASWLFMRVNTRHEFVLDTQNTKLVLNSGDIRELADTRRNMFEQLGLIENNSAQVGFGDIDWYVRFGKKWDYTLKFKFIDAGIRLGVLFPTGLTRELDRPGSIPFGGDGHWGIYTTLESIFEVKDDMKAGVFVRLSKRFANTKNRRMPVGKEVCLPNDKKEVFGGEPFIFGTVCGPARVNPGFTIVFSPYFILEGLREGMGLGIYYTLTGHQRDSWCDARADTTIPVRLNAVERFSKWRSEYISLLVFYDFGKVKLFRELDPILSFKWDVPTDLLITERSLKTQRISLGVEFAF